MTTDPPCPRRGKLIRACRFEARYDTPETKMPPAETLSRFLFSDMVPALRAMRARVYVHDVCVTCGKVVNR